MPSIGGSLSLTSAKRRRGNFAVASRYLLGIDLGTTNSALAYIDTQVDAETKSKIRVFPVPQLVEHGEVRTLPGLPSFIYFPTEDELSSGRVSATWDENPPMVTGVLARDQGALVPSRQVSSAKSWLSYAGVDRRANILPAQAEPPQPTISPVEASARYLMHLRDAWNAAHGSAPETRFENQDIVLTVPASFDEEVRELTVEAARRARLQHVTLLEEPLAAFYAWMAATPDSSSGNLSSRDMYERLRDNDLILICDVGGGTSDFSLVKAREASGEWQFERTAIGEHILLGGDNLDLALARLVEEKLHDKLSLRRRYALRRACSAAKEQLLSDSSLQRVAVTVLGSGHTVVGQAVSVDLTREEVLRTLTEGFLPITSPDDIPTRGRMTGLRELGLPYASDPAITRHLAAFLAQASVTMNAPTQQLVRPDAVLFNGGFFTPAIARERVLEAIAGWFGERRTEWRPRVLENEAVESAVARGAAYYGRVRRGSGLRVRAGSARTYYIGLRSQTFLECICILPAGTQEGTTLGSLNRDFSVVANRPVSFELYSSRFRHDIPGQVTELNEATVHRHSPLVAMLRFGKRLRDKEITVRLRASFTELGTLELWCESRDTPHRWRLQFELRSEEAQAQQLEEAATLQVSPPPPLRSIDDASIESAITMIGEVFTASNGDTAGADALVSRMEATLGQRRDSWPIATVRRFAEVLLKVASGRQKSARHEVRWLNLTGFCLRPGFGTPGDELLLRRGSTIASSLNYPDDVQCQVERLVFLRRVAGGINASEQHALYRAHVPSLETAGRGTSKRKSRLNPQLEHEAWRLAANLEHLSASTRASLGKALLTRIEREPNNAIRLWSLGRLGSRIPLYGPLHCVVDPQTAGRWVQALLELSTFTPAVASAVVQIAIRTDDRSRDIDNTLREQVILRLSTLGVLKETVQLLSKFVPPERADAVRSFGESLPPGLEVVTSSNCLLSLPGLQSYRTSSSKKPA